MFGLGMDLVNQSNRISFPGFMFNLTYKVKENKLRYMPPDLR